MVDFCPDDTPQLQAWRAEVRRFLDRELPQDLVFDYDCDEDDDRWAAARQFWRKLGARGWISLTWPVEYYGLGRPPVEKWILQEELCNYGAPSHPVIGLAVANTILRLGAREQRLRHLKGIADATVLWGEGYSEPGAGSDLAALTTRAHRDGDHWVLNGQKTLGTAAHRCQWMSVLARTDPNSRKHAGISCFLVPLDTPGITLTPLHNMANGQQNHTFFDDARIPADCLLGTLNQGWNEVWLGVGGERIDPAAPTPEPWQFRILRMLNTIIGYCRTTMRRGAPLADDPVVRARLAELVLGVEALKLHAYEAYGAATAPGAVGGRAGRSFAAQAFHKEFWPRMAQTCMEIVGPMAQLQGGRWSVLEGQVQQYFRASFGNHAGGTSQLKRMMLATRSLGMPR